MEVRLRVHAEFRRALVAGWGGGGGGGSDRGPDGHAAVGLAAAGITGLAVATRLAGGLAAAGLG